LEPTPELYVEHLCEVFDEVWRVLRDDGTAWLVIGDSYCAAPTESIKPKEVVGIPWMVAFALRSRGWYIRSAIVWEKTNTTPESVTDRPTKSYEHVFLLTNNRAIITTPTPSGNPPFPSTIRGKEIGKHITVSSGRRRLRSFQRTTNGMRGMCGPSRANPLSGTTSLHSRKPWSSRWCWRERVR
jgi:hypothetical protein